MIYLENASASDKDKFTCNKKGEKFHMDKSTHWLTGVVARDAITIKKEKKVNLDKCWEKY